MGFRLVYLFSFVFILSCQSTDDSNVLERILSRQSNNPLLRNVLDSLDKYEVQIIYTEIDRAEKQKPLLTRHTYNLDTSTYFYPASTVKMPVAFLAIEQFEKWQKEYPELSLDTRMVFDSIRSPQSKMDSDSCSVSGHPTLRSLVTTLFTISDNNAYNRLYELLGQEHINQSLYDKGAFTNSVIRTRVGVGGFDSVENSYLPSISFLSEQGDTILKLPPRQSIFDYNHTLQNTIKGVGYYDSDVGGVVDEPFDMGQKNFISLADLDRSLKRMIMPEMYEESERYDISEKNRAFILEAMQNLPREVDCYVENKNDYYDSYVKLLLFGDSKEPIPDHISIYNKVGFAYGYLIDVAYVEDTKNDKEFFLSAIIHVNENQIYNDGNYEYDSVGIPFLAELGRVVYDSQK